MPRSVPTPSGSIRAALRFLGAGRLAGSFDFPRIQGGDIAGVVVEVGPDVTGELGSKGDAVLANGAAEVFNRDSPDLLARIRAAAPCGLDAVADIAGGPGLSAIAEAQKEFSTRRHIGKIVVLPH